MRVCHFQMPPDRGSVTPFHFLTPPKSELIRKLPVNSIASIATEWKPPRFEVVRGSEASDIFFCLRDWAVTEPVIDAISAKTSGDVEFLPIDCDYDEPLFLLHVLRFVEIGQKTDVRRNPLSKNITAIHKYDFEADSLASCTLFRIRQTPGSLAANAGLARPDIYVVGEFADFLVECGFKGVDLVPVFDSGN